LIFLNYRSLNLAIRFNEVARSCYDSFIHRVKKNRVMNKNEFWKDIPNYEGYYQVSNLGRIKRVSTNKIRKSHKENNGYHRITLSKDGVRNIYLVHQLVAFAFLNHNTDKRNIVVDHIDNDKSNNHLDNLQVVSNRVNTSKDRRGGTSKKIGVHYQKSNNRWIAQICINGKQKYLGCYKTELEASKIYHKTIQKYKLL